VIPALQTRRLILNALELVDAAQIQVLFSDWEIVRFLTVAVPWPYPSDGAHTWCRDMALRAMERGDAWHWTIRLRDKPLQIIGCISLMRNDRDNRGFWLGRPWQGAGLMTEAVDVVTDFWFNTLNFPVLRVPKAVPNAASRRISEKQGMRVIAIEERDYVSGRFPAEVWEITADEWNHRSSQSGQD
jgi:ribosomal-protein-alanine N-acetyltransferase